MIKKKDFFHYSITAVNTIIAICALYLAFSHNKQLTDVDFLWEAKVAQYIPVELEKEQDSYGDYKNVQYSLSVWLSLKIVNTGFRVFTVDQISVLVSPLEVTSSPDKKIANAYPGNLTKPQGNGMPTSEKIELPVVIQPGHSKYFLKKIQIPISQNIYSTYKQKFKNGKSETLLFNKNDCSIFQKYDITSYLFLAGGQTKVAYSRLCSDSCVSVQEFIKMK